MILTKTRKEGNFNVAHPVVVVQDANGILGGYVWWEERWHSASWDKSGKFLRPGLSQASQPHAWDLDLPLPSTVD